MTNFATLKALQMLDTTLWSFMASLATTMAGGENIIPLSGSGGENIIPLSGLGHF